MKPWTCPNVEGLIAYERHNVIVPIPHASSWEDLNRHL
jgi:hypothetical protein